MAWGRLRGVDVVVTEEDPRGGPRAPRRAQTSTLGGFVCAQCGFLGSSKLGLSMHMTQASMRIFGSFKPVVSCGG